MNHWSNLNQPQTKFTAKMGLDPKRGPDRFLFGEVWPVEEEEEEEEIYCEAMTRTLASTSSPLMSISTVQLPSFISF